MIRLEHQFSKRNEEDARNICTCYPRDEDAVMSRANRGSPAGRQAGLRARLLGIPGVCGPCGAWSCPAEPRRAALISERCGLVWAWEDGSQGDCFKMERAEGLLGHLHSQIRAGHHSFPGGK